MNILGDRRLKPVFYLVCVGLAGWMLWVATHPWRAFQVDRINKDLGLWSLRFLFACLLIAPVSRILRAPWLRRWRRPLGLAAFVFAVLHALHFLLWGRVWPDHMDALVRVDDRRWDLRMKDGSLIQLPAQGEEQALMALEHLDERLRILDLGFERIDLRNPDLVAVRPRANPIPSQTLAAGA